MVSRETEVQNLQNRLVALERQLAEAQSVILALTSTTGPQAQADSGRDHLVTSEERFQQAIRVAPYPLMIRREDGRVVMINEAWTEITGYTLEDIPTIGEWTRKAYGKRGVNTRSLILSEGFFHEGIRKWGEFEVTTRSGKKRIWDFSSAPLGVDQNGRRLVLSMAVDVTERKRAEEELREARDRAMWLARFPDENPNPVARVSAEGTVLYHNPSAASLAGWGCEVAQLLPPPLLSLIERAIAQDQVVEQDLALGERFYWIAVRPIVDEGYANLYGRDITERKQAEDALRQSEAKFARTFQSNPAAMTITRIADARYTDTNQSFCQMVGYNREEIVGHTSVELGLFTNAEREEILRQFRKKGHVHQQEFSVVTKNRTRRRVLLSLDPIEVAGEPSILATMIDITERKRAEQALAEFAKKLERSNQELEQFAFMASHDLREPLNKIESFGEALVQSATELDDRQRDYIERMRAASARMRNIIDSLLQLSRINTKGEPFVPVDLSIVAAEVLSDLERQIHHTSGSVYIGKLPEVQGDPLQLHQLFQNLIGNALKFHQPDTPPLVKVYARQVPEAVQILVEDNGIGFNQKDAERIFQPFLRLVGRSQYEGSGMGLSICRRIVARHDGEITARSAPGKGSIFIVTLPSRVGEMEENQTDDIG